MIAVPHVIPVAIAQNLVNAHRLRGCAIVLILNQEENFFQWSFRPLFFHGQDFDQLE